MQPFAMAITELRALGFAEGFPIEPTHHARGLVARLESGRIGVAVEFCAHGGTPTYAVVPLLVEGGDPGHRRSEGSATPLWPHSPRSIVCPSCPARRTLKARPPGAPRENPLRTGLGGGGPRQTEQI